MSCGCESLIFAFGINLSTGITSARSSSAHRNIGYIPRIPACNLRHPKLIPRHNGLSVLIPSAGIGIAIHKHD